jgi:hypothetical protein
VHTSVISPVVRWGTLGAVVAMAITIASLRMCGDVDLPSKMAPPSISGEASDLLKTSSASRASWRQELEHDARKLGVSAPSDTEVARELVYRGDSQPIVLAPGVAPAEAAGLRLTAIAIDDSANRQALALTIENLTDFDLAYHVVTTPRPGGTACNQRLVLAHNAIVVPRRGKVLRTECIYRQGMSLAIDRVETVALGPLASAYVSRLPPAALGTDARLARGHRPELPAGMGVCSTLASQSVRTEIENGTISWRDLVDFYARHSCATYQFPERYKAFEGRGELRLPVSP